MTPLNCAKGGSGGKLEDVHKDDSDNDNSISNITLLQFVKTLLEANPEGILVTDVLGMIPFVPIIRSWIDEHKPLIFFSVPRI